MSDFFVVPHTHWDREWYAPFEVFRIRLAHVVDEVLDVLERNPQFTSFTLDGQAVILEDYLDVRPQNESRLRALLAAGRIEVGPSYVLPDEFLVGGEALVRNLLLGRAVCERFGATPTPVGYLPDSFGHPLQLPQILAGFGIASFIFSRGMGDEIEDVGVVFRWRAPDGSEVLALQQLSHYGNFAAIVDAQDAEVRVHAIVGAFGDALGRAGVDVVLLCNGSDHLPIQPEMPTLCVDLERRFPGARFAIASYREYVEAVGDPDVPAFEGELLGSRLHNILRGVNSARVYLKQANERAERLLGSVETLAAVRALGGGPPFPVSDFRLAWRDLLRCQPHDSICGCSCDEVHRDMLVRYASLERTLAMLQHEALAGAPARDSPGVLGLFNPLPWRRRALVELPGFEPQLVHLDGFGAASVSLIPTPSRERTDGVAIESDRLRVQARPDGTLTVIDLAAGRRFEGLHRLEDEPDMGDLYNFCPVEGAEVCRGAAASACVVRDGPVVWELELRVQSKRFSVTTVVRLVSGSGRVEFLGTVENRAGDHRLRVVFPVPAAEAIVRAEGQFALVRRPRVPAPPKTGWVEPPDPTQHTLGAVALGPIALITRGLPEYEARPVDQGAELCLTLLRCVGLISHPSNVLATRPLGAGPSIQTPDGQCPGRHEFEYALLLDADGLDDAALLRASQDYRFEFLALPAGVQFETPLRVEGDSIFSCLKGAENGDGLILRCFNAFDSPASARVCGPVTVVRTRLDETGEEEVADGRVELGPRQIATLRLRQRRPGAG